MKPFTTTTAAATKASRKRLGVIQGLTAYLVWGAFPIYFKAVASVPASEVLVHRIIWSSVLLLAFVIITGRIKEFSAIITNGRSVAILFAATLSLSSGWLVFIKAVADDRVLEASLGYYITPLVSIFLGFVFLREKLSVRQTLSVALAAAGVVLQAVMVGRLPMESLILAVTFALYGLIRKTVRVPAVTGLTVQMLLISPLALAFSGFVMARGEMVFLSGVPGMDALLVLAGAVTVTPLLFHAAALQHLRLSTLGFMQYIFPTVYFLLAVFLYGEPFTSAHLVSFGFIWAGLLLYSYDSLNTMRSIPFATGAVEEPEGFEI